MKKTVAFVVLIICATMCFAQQELLGEWRTVDDKTGEEKAVVRLFKATDGLYYGKLERIVDERYHGKGYTCELCKGADKGKPIEGLIIIRQMRYEDGKLVGGHLIDPETGNTYYGSISIDKESGKLKLRGSIDKRGILGRSQYWIR